MFYTIYLIGTRVHSLYDTLIMSKCIYEYLHLFSYTKYTYLIHDEIWELIDSDEPYFFSDFICL